MLCQTLPLEDVISALMRETGEDREPQMAVHLKRYTETYRELLQYDGPREAALEVGYTKLFQIILSRELGFAKCYGTEFRSADQPQSTFTAENCGVQTNVLRVNLEHDLLPLPDDSLDLVICCEVLEHMDIDPMFMLAELNRVLKTGGRLLITTPNSASARMVWKVLHGYRPQFYMQYMRNRNPYRHNYEHDIHSVIALGTAAGFETVALKTFDNFEPTCTEGLAALEKLGMPLEYRGDNIFWWGRKISGVVERWPIEIYV